MVAASPVPLSVGIRVHIRGEELETGSGEVLLSSPGENTEAVGPSFGLGSDGFVVRVERRGECESAGQTGARSSVSAEVSCNVEGMRRHTVETQRRKMTELCSCP